MATNSPTDVTSLTARDVADALGRHIVRGVYEMNDDDGPMSPELHLQFEHAPGNPVVLVFAADGHGAPCLTDLGMTFSALTDYGHGVDVSTVKAIAEPLGVSVTVGDTTYAVPELSRRLDARNPAQDAMAIVACVLQLVGHSRVPAPNPKLARRARARSGR